MKWTIFSEYITKKFYTPFKFKKLRGTIFLWTVLFETILLGIILHGIILFWTFSIWNFLRGTNVKTHLLNVLYLWNETHSQKPLQIHKIKWTILLEWILLILFIESGRCFHFHFYCSNVTSLQSVCTYIRMFVLSYFVVINFIFVHICIFCRVFGNHGA